MFNNLHKKVKVLDGLNGDGALSMNKGELSYSIFGPMKKAAVLRKDVMKGDILSLEMINFIRTKEISDMSQVDVIQAIGKTINRDINVGTTLMNEFLLDK
jgi:N,N'-diacetyllegionaminate synthase